MRPRYALAASLCAAALSGCGARSQLGDLAPAIDATTEADAADPTDACATCSGPTSVAAGYLHVCALRGGRVFCWGHNANGAVGDGTTDPRLRPTLVPDLPGIATLTIGNSATYAITAGGAVFAWGLNSTGQLADGTMTPRLRPTPIASLSDSAQIAAGDGFACALSRRGEVRCWGINHRGQIGDGSTTTRLTPTPVRGLPPGVLAIALGDFHACALLPDRQVTCWGWNESGQLGIGSRSNQSMAGQPVRGLIDVARLELGGWSSCAITLEGSAWCWGHNDAGQVGDGSTQDAIGTRRVQLRDRALRMGLGGRHACALLADRSVWCWGSNEGGGLGVPQPGNQLVPRLVSGLPDADDLDLGGYYSCAHTPLGDALWCWGEGRYGALGNGTVENRFEPGAVPL